MHIFFDTSNCIGALPGGIIIGHTEFEKETLTCYFHDKKHFVIPEKDFVSFLKLLEDLSHKMIQVDDEEENEDERLQLHLKDGTLSSNVSN